MRNDKYYSLLKSSLVVYISIFVVMFFCLDYAMAWECETCDGRIYKGMRGAETFRLDRCSIPSGTLREQDFIFAMTEWNNIFGMEYRFGWTDGTTNCTITTGDGNWDLAVVDRSEIDGANGHIEIRYSPCVWPYWEMMDGDLREADIFIASSDLDVGATLCNTNDQSTRRGVILHELGHALGMKHEDSKMSLMNPSSGPGNSHGKYCSNNIGSSDDHTSAPHPDDIEFGFTYHKLDGYFVSYDAGASAFYYNTSTHKRELTTATEIIEVCPGNSVWYRWSWGNRGYNTMSYTYNKAKIVLSTNDYISSYDIPVQSWGIGAGQGVFSTWSSTFTVPTSVVYGQEYYIGVIVDYNDAYDEYYETNNITYLARKIKIKNSPQCP